MAVDTESPYIAGSFDYQMSRERGLECEPSGKSIRTELADEQVLDLLQEQIRRVGRAYLSRSIDDETPDRKVRTAQDELGRLVMPSADDLMEVGMQIEKLEKFLGEASAAERSEISHLLLEEVSFDLEQGQVTRIKPNKPLQFLFALVADELEWKDDGHSALKMPKPKKDGSQK